MGDKLSLSYFIPFIVAMLGSSIPTIIGEISKLEFLNDKWEGLLIWGAGVLSIAIILWCFTQMIYNQINQTELRKAFYEDYLEIIQKRKKNCE
ncbi:hypothetical protein LIZ87_18850 [Lacrimispora sp. 210928-DFI.3.58]|nr:hypothetical protein [Lacrimispora sp. 210928-DFI.3.58]